MSTTAVATRVHRYTSQLTWEGNLGEGTPRYDRYGRRYRVRLEGKPDLAGTADAAFRGEPGLYNPEELFLASISACHMLFYLALCARSDVSVVTYEDEATGVLAIGPDGGGRFEEVTLRPAVAVSRVEMVELASSLHETAHERCFIARSCSVPIRCQATVNVAGATQ